MCLTLTFIPQCEPTHLWKVFERLQADHSSKHLKADDGDLILFDEAWSNCAFLVCLLVNQAQQRLVMAITTLLIPPLQQIMLISSSNPVFNNFYM